MFFLWTGYGFRSHTYSLMQPKIEGSETSRPFESYLNFCEESKSRKIYIEFKHFFFHSLNTFFFTPRIKVNNIYIHIYIKTLSGFLQTQRSMKMISGIIKYTLLSIAEPLLCLQTQHPALNYSINSLMAV